MKLCPIAPNRSDPCDDMEFRIKGATVCRNCPFKKMKGAEKIEKIRNELSPEWLRDCVMFEKNHNSIVLSPARCLRHGISNLKVAQGEFSSKTVIQIRLDYDVRRMKGVDLKK